MITLKLILPKNLNAYLNADAAERNLMDALDHTINIVNDDFQATVKSWTKQPKFDKKGARKIGGRLEAQTSTNNEIYFYVTRGTSPHPIIPKKASRLSFRTGYRAKTRVRVIGSRAGGSFGPRVTARSVLHPGTEARDFDREIAKRRQRNMTNLCREAILKSFRFGGIR